jgi:hypothetical protein
MQNNLLFPKASKNSGFWQGEKFESGRLLRATWGDLLCGQSVNSPCALMAALEAI